MSVLTEARDAMMEQVRQLKQQLGGNGEAENKLKQDLRDALLNRQQLEDTIQVCDPSVIIKKERVILL